ncbi:MAG: hypothetical protein M3167_11715 [Acidobacteriota bacterium]|nr:hypothetical protein [Acidobacteriota bacterium]
MKRFGLLALLLVCAAPVRPEQPGSRTKQFLSPVYSIDRRYRSEEGPWSRQTVTLADATPRELLWITGIRTEMIGPDAAPMLPEFMCHVSLNFEDVEKHRANFGWGNQGIARILALSQGELSARLPAGFGIPLFSDEGLTLTTRVLNHNRPDERFEVRHRVTIEFLRDADARDPMKALRNVVGHVLVPLQPAAGKAAMHDHTHADDGDDDHAGVAAPTMVAGVLKDSHDREFVGHWVVKPGREVRKKNVTETLQIPFDTTLHYSAVHMHPFAESLELRDLTTGESLVKILARPLAKGIGMEHVDSFSSAKGVPIYKDHQYQMISVYNNTTSVDQDSMAVMFLFVLDRQFRRPG